MAKTILGKAGFTPKGGYDPAEEYKILDIIRFNGRSYLALKDFTGIEPVGDDVVTMLLTDKGDKGDAFTYADFTAEQLALLALTFDKLTPEQKKELEGKKGDPGDSAYLTWKKEEGNEGKTYEEYKLYNQLPAMAAAVEVRAELVKVSQSVKQTLDETRIKVDDILASGGMYNVISSDETEVGKLRWEGKEYAIYELTIELSGLPTSGGVSANVILSNNPMGDDLYLNIDCLSVFTDTGFTVSLYEIKRIFVDAEKNTVAEIICKESVSGIIKALLTIRYIKGILSYNVFQISIPLQDLVISSVDEVTIGIPSLKYNKGFALSWTTDDSLLCVYSYLHKYINKKYIDDTYNYHDGMPPTTGFDPTRVLCFTDGCGNDVRFRVDSGWVSYNNNGSDGIHSESFPYQYVRWSELVSFLDFGNTVTNHGGGDQTKPLESIQMNAEKLVEKTGFNPFLLLVPGGTTGYQDIADKLDYIYHYHNKENLNYSTDSLTQDSFKRKTGLLGRKTYDGMTYEQLCSYVDTQAVRTDHPYMYLGGHVVADANEQIKWTDAVKPFLDYLYDTYGKAGNDTIWMAGPEEIYEYLFTRAYSVIGKSIDDGNLIVSVKVASLPLFRRHELSILVKKNSGELLESAQATSVTNDLVKFAYSVKNDTMLINLNYNRNLLEIAEKYTDKYEKSVDPVDKEDAIYFADQLKDELRTPFISRINAVDAAPIFNYLSINAGDVMTYNPNIEVVLNVIGIITHYKVSEVSDLSGAVWIENTSKKFNFVLSSGFGNKIIYVKLKNSNGESEIKSSSIMLEERPVITYTVTGQSNNSEYGTVSPETQVLSPGESANLTALAKTGYIIDNWDGATSSTGAEDSSGTAIVSNVQADQIVRCNFKQGEPMSKSVKSVYSVQNTASSSYAVLDSGDVVNLIRMNNSSGNTRFDIKDTKGNVIGQIIQETVDLEGSQPVSISTNSNPNLSGDNGVYEDKYINSLIGVYSSSLYPEHYGERKWILSQGIYNLKILYSSKTTLSTDKVASITFDCNGVIKSLPSDYPYFNNNLTFFEINDVSVGSDGILDLKFGSTAAYVRAGFNLIEIEKIS